MEERRSGQLSLMARLARAAALDAEEAARQEPAAPRAKQPVLSLAAAAPEPRFYADGRLALGEEEHLSLLANSSVGRDSAFLYKAFLCKKLLALDRERLLSEVGYVWRTEQPPAKKLEFVNAVLNQAIKELPPGPYGELEQRLVGQAALFVEETEEFARAADQFVYALPRPFSGLRFAYKSCRARGGATSVVYLVFSSMSGEERRAAVRLCAKAGTREVLQRLVREIAAPEAAELRQEFFAAAVARFQKLLAGRDFPEEKTRRLFSPLLVAINLQKEFLRTVLEHFGRLTPGCVELLCQKLETIFESLGQRNFEESTERVLLLLRQPSPQVVSLFFALFKAAQKKKKHYRFIIEKLKGIFNDDQPLFLLLAEKFDWAALRDFFLAQFAHSGAISVDNIAAVLDKKAASATLFVSELVAQPFDAEKTEQYIAFVERLVALLLPQLSPAEFLQKVAGEQKSPLVFAAALRLAAAEKQQRRSLDGFIPLFRQLVLSENNGACFWLLVSKLQQLDQVLFNEYVTPVLSEAQRLDFFERLARAK